MSQTTRRIERRMAESAEFRAHYEALLAEEKVDQARREAVMGMLAEARKEAHVTQREMALRLKISQARVSQIERGVETVSVDRLLDMVQALGVHLAVLTEEDVKKHGLGSKVVTDRSEFSSSESTLSEKRGRPVKKVGLV